MYKITFFFLFLPSIAFAQISDPNILSESLLQDRNGNGVIEIAAFGDSLTRGVGDFNASGQSVSTVSTPGGEAGYPLRIESLVGIPVSNLGSPGEKMISEGRFRFASTIPSLSADVVIISEGANDAIVGNSRSDHFRSLQTMINIARASNKEVVLATINPVCCNHASLGPSIETYNSSIREAATINGLTLANVAKAFRNTCESIGTCSLLNRPEGLHPNIKGYDVMGEAVIASLLQIDLFAEDGASKLEQALNLTEGSVLTKPDPAS